VAGQTEPTRAKTLVQLRDEMEDADLIEAHDSLLKTANYVIGPDYYLTELSRRDQERASEVMVEQTRTMVKLTWVIAALTVVNVIAVIVAAVR
jgi:hypothetical protein